MTAKPPTEDEMLAIIAGKVARDPAGAKDFAHRTLLAAELLEKVARACWGDVILAALGEVSARMFASADLPADVDQAVENWLAVQRVRIHQKIAQRAEREEAERQRLLESIEDDGITH